MGNDGRMASNTPQSCSPNITSAGISNRARGERHAGAELAPDATTLHRDETPSDRATRATWARLIQKVYEFDPLECPKCSHTLRVIAVIDAAAVIRRILKHLRLWNPEPRAPDGAACQS